MTINFNIGKYDNNQKVWRYLDFTKFISLMDSEKLFLARADSFTDDPFEGSYPIKNIESRKSIPGITSDLLIELERVNKKFKEYVYINCWHANDYESAAMWNLYLKSNEGLTVQTSLGRLARSIKNDRDYILHIHEIKYIDYSKDGFNDNNVMEAFCHKRKSFEHEREIRLIRTLLQYSEANDILNDPKNIIVQGGLAIDVDLDILVENIFIAPNAPGWFIDLVKAVLIRYDLIYNTSLFSRVRKSDLRFDPIF
ncbi:hypothetical protein [Desulfosporosinus sp. OT]|uniref:hypothetical protein n=1 Tax=Desulfosporosinus sp. OT TaxID=913865 RepID=UPI000223A917|nr:hypothetical protein [Desulfosporosinus sp. OT]EGW39081.1 hypothetical protein DOT_3032 [Desulfosporosinus sp. OT]